MAILRSLNRELEARSRVERAQNRGCQFYNSIIQFNFSNQSIHARTNCRPPAGLSPQQLEPCNLLQQPCGVRYGAPRGTRVYRLHKTRASSRLVVLACSTLGASFRRPSPGWLVGGGAEFWKKQPAKCSLGQRGARPDMTAGGGGGIMGEMHGRECGDAVEGKQKTIPLRRLGFYLGVSVECVQWPAPEKDGRQSIIPQRGGGNHSATNNSLLLTVRPWLGKKTSSASST